MILNRYIRKSIISSTLIVILVLMVIDTFIEFVGQLTTIGVAHYNLLKVVIYVMAQLPHDMYQLFPMTGFLGSLIGLGYLASTGQLNAMRTAGMSVGSILVLVMRTAGWMILVMFLIGEYIAPKLQLASERMRSKALMNVIHYQNMENFWIKDNNSFIHVGSLVSNNKMNDITRFVSTQDHQLQSLQYADEAEFVNDHWELKNVIESRFENNRVKRFNIARLPIALKLNPNMARKKHKHIERESLVDLYQDIRYRDDTSSGKLQYMFAFWRRLFQPVVTVMMICLGVPFIFGSLREVSMSLRVMTGIILGFFFYMLNQFFGPLAMVYQINPFVAAIIPSVLFLAVCGILLRRSWL